MLNVARLVLAVTVLLAITQFGVSETVQEVVQAATPPRRTLCKPSCRQTVFQHQFANSYGAPYVGSYRAPSGCNFTTTIFRLSVSSSGRQYDRLALLYFGDVEVWRTSTAMPKPAGIHWVFDKDVTVFDSLLRQEQKVIFDLGNVVDGKLYTGVWNVTMEALYFNDDYGPGFQPAEQIHAISTLSSAKNTTSVFSLPDDSGAVTLTLPRNIKTVVVSLLASGNGAEEFWFTNVPTEYTNTFPDNGGWLYGYSPFREVQLLIDGNLAGVSWPFPILFTGGVDPGAWRPVVGIDAFDLPSFEIDVTPWLALLCDGKPHKFQLQVVGFDSSTPNKLGPVGENWWVSGSIFVWLDKAIDQAVAGEVMSITPVPTFALVPEVGTVTSQNGAVSNSSLYFKLTAERSLSISSIVQIAAGSKIVTWEQKLSFSNIQNMTDQAFNQSLAMVTSGSHTGTASNIASHYRYPINLFSAYVVAPTNPVTSPGSVFCMVDRSLVTDGLVMLPFLSGLSYGREKVATRQNVTSSYHWKETIIEGTPGLDTCDGETWYSYDGEPTSELGVAAYSRYLKEMDDILVQDNSAWKPMDVPNTEPLPAVEGEPAV